MAIVTPTQKSNQIVVLTQEESISIKSKQEILLLLKHLAEREKITVKLILDRLYDLGALNLMNNKLRSRTLKGVARGLAKISKPAAGVVGVYWFKQNCPQLIADWLVDQVAFGNKEENAAEVLEVSANNLKASELKNLEVKQLRSQVRLLTSILIVVITVFGGSFAWLFYSFKVQPASLGRPAECYGALAE